MTERLPKRPAETFTYTVPEGCHLVGLYNYTQTYNRIRESGIYAHLIMKEGWYDDEGQSLYGTSITGGYHTDVQSAIDDAYAKVLAHVAEVNAEIPLRKAKIAEHVAQYSKPAIKRQADDLLKLLGEL